MTRVHAFSDDVLGELDAVGLVDRIRSGTVSVPDVVEAAIARAERVNPELNAIVHEAWDRARDEARQPRGGYFAGVPTFVKDNVDVAGMPTRQGADAFEGRPRRHDGEFARMFLATGLIPLGKTQLSEFGFSASAEHPRLGPVRSPWDLQHTAGASSAGSAAMVAAGVVPIAHANDGGGSIRIPASVNGLVGLKPTRDRLAQDRMMREMPVRIVADGVLTRSVRDTAAFYREAEKVYRKPELRPVGDITHAGKVRLDIAVVTEGIGRSASPEVAELTHKTARLLEELGHRVQPIDQPLPGHLKDDFLLYWSLLALFMVRTGRRTFGRSWDAGQLDNLTHGLARHSTRNLHRLPLAIGRLKRTRRWSRSFFSRYDVVLTPTLAAETPTIGHLAPDPGLRHDHGPVAGLGGVHAAAERHRRPRHQPAAGHHRPRAPAGHDVRRRSGPRGHPPRARLRAGGGPSLGPDPGLRVGGGVRTPGSPGVPAHPRHCNAREVTEVPGRWDGRGGWCPEFAGQRRARASYRGRTRSACAERATSPRRSWIVDVATPTDPEESVVSASRHTHSPSGGRSTCRVSSVLRNAHERGSSSALAPDAESAHTSSRWSGEIGSPSTRSGDRIHTSAGPLSVTAPLTQRHSTASR